MAARSSRTRCFSSHQSSVPYSPPNAPNAAPVITTPSPTIPPPGGHGQVRDERVLGFTRTMGDHRPVPVAPGHVDALERFRQRADLIDLDQDRVPHPALY